MSNGADRPLLQSGAKIRVIAPSRWIERTVPAGIHKLADRLGLQICFSEQCFQKHHQLAGDDRERAREFEQAMSDRSVDAVWFARGGYGAGRMMEYVDWSGLDARCIGHPKKVVIGYSDATPLLEAVSRIGLAQAVHGSMPVDIENDTNSGAPGALLETLVSLPASAINQKAISGCQVLRSGTTKGALRGGNLTLLTKMLSGDQSMRFDGAILFIEDVEEYDYAIDRDLLCLRQTGALAKLAGIVVGQFTKTVVSSVPFEQSVAEMVLHHARDFDYPILNGLQSGHGSPNEPLLFDQSVEFVAGQDTVHLASVT